MASLCTPMKYAPRWSSPLLRGPQRRWAQVHDVRFLATHQRPDQKILAKYRAKLEQKAKEEGHGDIETLKSAYKEKIVDLRKKASVPGATAPLNASTKPSPTPNTPTPSSAATNPYQPPPPPPEPQQTKQRSSEEKAGIKTLSSFANVEELAKLSQTEIEYLWRLRHASQPNSLCAVVPTETHNKIVQTAKKHPQFILPLPKEGQGAEIHFLQWTFPSPTTVTVLFTNLAEFKLRGEFAQPHTTVTHHLDLADDKGVVLLHGTVFPDRGVTVEEGQWLLMCLQKFYGQAAEQTPRRKLMEQFSKGDGNFKVEDLLEEAEKI